MVYRTIASVRRSTGPSNQLTNGIGDLVGARWQHVKQRRTRVTEVVMWPVQDETQLGQARPGRGLVFSDTTQPYAVL